MKKMLCLLCLFFFGTSCFSDGTQVLHIDSYQKDKPLPSWAKDLRRAEIITLGSLPFTVLGVTLVYSVYRYGANDFKAAYIPNPFPLSSAEAKLNTNEQIGIFSTAAVLSLAVGLTDFIVIKIKEDRKKKTVRLDNAQQRGIRIENGLPAYITENTADRPGTSGNGAENPEQPENFDKSDNADYAEEKEEASKNSSIQDADNIPENSGGVSVKPDGSEA